MKYVISILSITVLLVSAYFNMSLPVVTYSFHTNKCVSVEPATAGSCQSLPNKYHHEWSY